ncbi:hypothetical protein OGAPHI_003048 [Ogataea philodendri]|uniref:Uncharacterized protein n=1 Tax=Ogataea philodendri TaxID=1378263 RepID=A0A9P8T6H4_9ASCO|nr:uncharacterized protein OGAPHI_003048 [Ogataea philodendri]KAH3667399.1 hypothetical protein OGAPHI_003048 [Ogataea philodendri]
MYATADLDSLPTEDDPSVNVDELWRVVCALVHDYVAENELSRVLDRVENSPSLLQQLALLAGVLKTNSPHELRRVHSARFAHALETLLARLDVSLVFGSSQIVTVFYTLLHDISGVVDTTGAVLLKLVHRVATVASMNASFYYLHYFTLKQLFAQQKYRDIAQLAPLLARHSHIEPAFLTKDAIFQSYAILAKSLMNTGHYGSAHDQFQILFKLPVSRPQNVLQNVVSIYAINTVLADNKRHTNLVKYGGLVDPHCCHLVQSLQTSQPTHFYQTVETLAKEYSDLVPQVFDDLRAKMRLRILQTHLELYKVVRLTTLESIDQFPDTKQFLEHHGYVFDNDILSVPEPRETAQTIDNKTLVAAITSLDRIAAKTSQTAQLKEAQKLRKQNSIA